MLEVTLRGNSEAVMDQEQAALERIVRGVAAAGRAPREPDIELLEHTLPVVNDADLTARVRAVHAALFPTADLVDLPWPNKGSEDFAYFGVPGPDRYPEPAIPIVMWFYGTTPARQWDAATGDLRQRIGQVPGQHTPFYAPDRLPSLRRGVETLVGAAMATLSTKDGAA